jgi:hypothetical protein
LPSSVTGKPRRPNVSETKVVCVFCGRVGSRGFVILSGNGDGTRDSWRCANSGACAKRVSDAEVDAMTDEQVVEALLRPTPPETGV